MDWRGAVFMVRPERVELSTFSLGMKCSIHLSYGRTGTIIADFAGDYDALGGVAAYSGAISSIGAVAFAFPFAIPYVLFASRPFPQATH